MRLFIGLLSLVFTFHSVVTPRVIELKSMHDLVHHCDLQATTNEDWFIFDLDNTVMCPTKESKFTDHGFKAWAKHRAEKKQISMDEAYQELLPFWWRHQETEIARAVEDLVVKQIGALQERGVVILGLTSRSEFCRDNTIRMTKELDIDFSKTHPKLELEFSHLPHKAAYYDGILFCSNNTKGQVLEVLLKNIACKPKRIFFFDDLERHVLDVRTVVKKFDIDFYGFRYGHLDEQVKSFKIEDHLDEHEK